VKPARGLLIGVALVGIALTAASISPRVTRTNLIGLEQFADGKIIQLDATNPGDILGKTRGVYLEGYGAVFTAEVDLAPHAALNPFRPKYTDADVSKLRTQKQARIDVLKKRMVESMVIMAQGLEGVPATERIALAVTIDYWPWEKSNGMPRQILIHAPKSALMSGAKLDEALKVQEF
jgi:hypothetical protein